MENISSIEACVIDTIYDVLSFPVAEKVNQVVRIIRDNNLQYEKGSIQVSTIQGSSNLCSVASYVHEAIETMVRFKLKGIWTEEIKILVEASIPEILFESIKEEYAKVGIFVFKNKEGEIFIQLDGKLGGEL